MPKASAAAATPAAARSAMIDVRATTAAARSAMIGVCATTAAARAVRIVAAGAVRRPSV
jgi:hypothetical protein